jgi:hypothetical protein
MDRALEAVECVRLAAARDFQGHGIEASGAIYCCAHCAEASGVEGARDRVEA